VFFIDRIFDFIMRPLYEKLPAGSKLIYTEPTEPSCLRVKIPLLFGPRDRRAAHRGPDLAVHRPGLYAHEKRFALPFI